MTLSMAVERRRLLPLSDAILYGTPVGLVASFEPFTFFYILRRITKFARIFSRKSVNVGQLL